MRRVSLIALLSVALFPGAGAATAQDAPAPPPGTAHITYLVGESAYIDAGREMGLVEGLPVEVVRNGARVAVLKVDYLSSRRASCAVESTDVELAVGDLVRFTPASESAAPAPAGPAASPPKALPRPEGTAAGLGLRGRVGVRYLTVNDLSGVGEDFSQPSLDAHVNGRRVGGSDFDLAVDVRARRTYRTHVDGETSNDGLTRVYRLNLAWQRDGSPYRVSVGRQISSEFASVSLFDGVLLERAGSRLGFGAFGGAEPEPVRLDFTTDVTEFGAYTQVKNAPGAPLRWTLTGGWTTSYASGEFNREFLFLRGNFFSERLYGTLSQEIDINRGWKAAAESGSLSPTSTYFNFRYRLSRKVSLNASLDNRRRVRLYRDRDTPESEFDDSFRQGIFTGADVRPFRALSVGVSLAHHLGESSGNARSYTLATRITTPAPVGVQAALRDTRFTGPWLSGWLHALGLSRRFGPRLDGEVHGGIRRETRSLGFESKESIGWWGANLDVSVTRGWYLLLSGERTSGGGENNNQVYTSLSYRF